MPLNLQPNKKLSVSISLLVVVVMLLPILFYCMADQSVVNALIIKLQPEKTSEYLLLLTLLTLAMSVGLPRQITAFSSGLLLGTTYGTVFSTLAASVACFLTFIFSSYVFHHRIQEKFPQKLTTLSDFFTENIFIKALVIRLIPVGSNFLTNVLAGTAKAPLLPYLCGTTVGFIPQMTLFSMLGAGVKVGDNQQVMISAGLLIVASMLIGYLYKKHKTNKKGANI